MGVEACVGIVIGFFKCLLKFKLEVSAALLGYGVIYKCFVTVTIVNRQSPHLSKSEDC